MQWMAQWIGELEAYVLGVAAAAALVGLAALLLWLLTLRYCRLQGEAGQRSQGEGCGQLQTASLSGCAGANRNSLGPAARQAEELRRLIAEADRRIGQLESLLVAAGQLGAAEVGEAAGTGECGQGVKRDDPNDQRLSAVPAAGGLGRSRAPAARPATEPGGKDSLGRGMSGGGQPEGTDSGQLALEGKAKEAAGAASAARHAKQSTGSIEARFAHVYWLADTGHAPAEIASKTGLHRGEVELLLRLRRSKHHSDPGTATARQQA